MIGVDDEGRGKGLGFALLGGGVAWTLHLMLAWALSEFACRAGVADAQVAGASVLTWILVALSLAMLALSAASTAYAYTLERRLRPAEVEAVVPSILRVGWLLGVLFTVTIAAQTLPLAWFVRGC